MFSWYRIEISGGFSGSAYRYHSFVGGTIGDVKAFLMSHLGNSQDASMIVTEGFAVLVEVHDGDEMLCRESVLPVLRLVGSSTAAFGDDGTPIWDGELLDETGLQDKLDVITDAFIDDVSIEVDFAGLSLPSPTGAPLPTGTQRVITNAAGVVHEQRCGEVVGEYAEAYQYAGEPS